jgi:hypothetical protein
MKELSEIYSRSNLNEDKMSIVALADAVYK